MICHVTSWYKSKERRKERLTANIWTILWESLKSFSYKKMSWKYFIFIPIMLNIRNVEEMFKDALYLHRQCLQCLIKGFMLFPRHQSRNNLHFYWIYWFIFSSRSCFMTGFKESGVITDNLVSIHIFCLAAKNIKGRPGSSSGSMCAIKA